MSLLKYEDDKIFEISSIVSFVFRDLATRDTYIFIYIKIHKIPETLIHIYNSNHRRNSKMPEPGSSLRPCIISAQRFCLEILSLPIMTDSMTIDTI